MVRMRKRKLFDKVIITKIVKEEFAQQIPDWIEIENPSDETGKKILELNIDAGEASAISLGMT